MNEPLNTFTPQTPTELMLWREIQRLRAGIKNADERRLLIGVEPDRKVRPVLPMPLPEVLQLPWTTELLANVTGWGSIEVIVRGRATRRRLEFRQYVSAHHRTDAMIVDMMHDLYRQSLPALADLLSGSR